MLELTKKLFELQDTNYADFQYKLTPTAKREEIIGVRVPNVRKLAGEYKNKEEAKIFLDTLPHNYYDEYMLHGLLISEIKDYETCIEKLDSFLPYVDNWAVCDICSPKCFKKNKEKLINKIPEWINNKHTYVCRFGIQMLMSHYLDNDFKKEYLELPSKIISNEYYVNMMIAWFFATSLTKQWDTTINYITEYKLPKWVHNKTIQKACESLRITNEQKEYLKTFKIK